MKIQILAFILLLGFSACGPQLRPFTTQLQQENRWSAQELRQIQFYNSRDIVLRRLIDKSSSDIVSGKIVVLNGREMEEVVIPARTPGVLVELPRINRFGVAFEQGGKQRFLMFGPDPDRGGLYKLLAKDVKQPSLITVTYENKEYMVNLRPGAPFLMVDLNKRQLEQRQSRRAKGVKLR